MGGTLGGDEEALRAFEQHLRIERGRSEHTTRAYLSDLRALRAYLTKDPPGDGYAPLLAADLGDLRGWLGSLAAAKASRATINRRAASVRTFYAWATRGGRLAANPALRLVTAGKARALPTILSAEQARATLLGLPERRRWGSGGTARPGDV